MAKTVTFKRSKEKWIKQFKPTHIKGKPIVPNLGVSRYFETEINKLVVRMEKDVKKELEYLLNNTSTNITITMANDNNYTSQVKILFNSLQKKWLSMFMKHTPKIIESFTKQIFKSNTGQLSNSFEEVKANLTIKKLNPATKEIIKASSYEIANLIKSIPTEFIPKIGNQAYRSVGDGSDGLSSLVKFLETTTSQSKRRIKNIALDQTRKINNDLTIQRFKDNNITHFEWVHSGGGVKPRKEHIEFSGKIYPIDKPPYDPVYGGRVMPGTAINCKCTLAPVFYFDMEKAS